MDRGWRSLSARAAPPSDEPADLLVELAAVGVVPDWRLVGRR
jgi:hypothetical protein